MKDFFQGIAMVIGLLIGFTAIYLVVDTALDHLSAATHEHVADCRLSGVAQPLPAPSPPSPPMSLDEAQVKATLATGVFMQCWGDQGWYQCHRFGISLTDHPYQDARPYAMCYEHTCKVVGVVGVGGAGIYPLDGTTVSDSVHGPTQTEVSPSRHSD